jgi:CRP/FNR family transcriptional regulator, anaerobic regulatory protein
MNDTIFSDAALLKELDHYTRIRQVPKDTVLIAPGDDVLFVPIVLKGVLRIVRQNEDGKEVFLYHLYPGQSCAMAINCCQGRKKSSIKAIAEEDTEVMQVPVNLLEDLLKYPEWKTYINNTYSQRFSELLDVVDLISFSNMDKQVLHYLQERARAAGTNALYITHQVIADELHTHREAISRLLRTMEQKGILRLGRNTIELIPT